MNFRKMYKSFDYAFAGLKYMVTRENNFQFQLLAAVLVTAAGCYYRITTVEWLAVILSIILVLALEMINTAIEKTIDIISPQYQTKAGIVKDVAAGAVLIAAMASLVVFCIVFWKYFFG